MSEKNLKHAKRKQSGRGRRIGATFFSLLMFFSTLLSAMPAMSLKVHADGAKAYTAYDVTTDTNKAKVDEALAALLVKFNNNNWYVIEDNSTAVDAGTLTLLAQDPIKTMAFDNEPDSEGQYSNSYNDSQVKAYLDGLTDEGGAYASVEPAIKAVKLTTYGYNGNTDEKEITDGAKLYLLSVDEVLKVPVNVRDLPLEGWWLRSPGSASGLACGVGDYGAAGWNHEANVADVHGGVRPALQLDLESVIFDPVGKTFTLPKAVTSLELDKTTTQTITVGNNVAFTATLAPENASYVKWNVTGDAVTLYSDAECTSAITTDSATYIKTVYAKGTELGSATVSVTSNSDTTKTTSCAISVKYEDDPYAAMVNNSAATVKFNDLDWYIIEDNSTTENAGTLTLLAKAPIANKAFDSKDNEEDVLSNSYNDSKVKAYLDGLLTSDGENSFKDVATAIKETDLTTYDFNSDTAVKETTPKAKLYLLSVDEALKVSKNIRALNNAWWWLRSPGQPAGEACGVESLGDMGWIFYRPVNDAVGVRPALKLDLSAVSFSASGSEKAFTVKPAPTVTTAPVALSLTYNGNEQELVTGGEAQGGTLYYALGEDTENEPEFDGLSDDANKKWSTDIPKASAIGTYPVWYMVKGNTSHRNSEAVCITAEIKEQPAPPVSYYTIRFEMNGHGEAVTQQRIRSGGKVRRPEDPTDADYDFIDWYTDQECTKEYDFNKKVMRSFKLYAKWVEKNAETFTVSFDMQQHGEQIPVQTIVSGETAEKPADPSVEDYDFGGWYTSAECKAEELYDFATPVTADLILYAKWTKKQEPQPGPVIHSALDPVPVIDVDTTELYLVKGQKFIIGKDWSVKKEDKTSKALVSISKKSGQLKAKKDGTAIIWNGERSLILHISAPSIPKKLELQIAADGAESKAIELTNPDGLPVYWYSASPDVATVDEEGMVTAVSAGKAVVTAYINGSAYKCSISVKEAVVAKERTLHMTAGGTKKLNIKGVNKPIWSSADEDTAAFDKNKLTAKKAGETILTATTEDGTEYKVHLYVEDVTLTGEGLTPAKTANKYTLKLKAGGSTELSFVSVDQAVVFKSSKPDSAFIDENGKVDARTKGKSKFTTKLNGKTITVNVSVE